MSNRNHEGYHDPTASQAIRRADRGHKEAVKCRGADAERAALRCPLGLCG